MVSTEQLGKPKETSDILQSLFDRAFQPSGSGKRVAVGSPYRSTAIFGPQGQRLIPTITQEMCGCTGLSACLVFMPPGRIARPHFHARSDIIVMVLEGFAASLIGPDLEPVFHGPGEFIYIPEGVVHVAVNLSTQSRLIAVEARTDPKFNEDVVLSSEYDERASEIVADLHRMFASGELEIPVHWNVGEMGPFRFADVEEADLLPQ
ncbi:cupin domain-containing protein [Rhizobium leguminosarum]|uniref:cupin domain-containing protein n=1 Tax=Rhizobium leguminosarum TaxID=384 RepID=UPI001C9705AE|nr:cupin domain-containing protein [Rhizobium leguminosarum]MBY5827912.1 cupin domain-containing protein [Rhizobium leguminosarum]